MARPDAFQTFFVISEFYDAMAFNSPVLEENLQKRLTEGMEKFGYQLDSKKPDLIVRYNTLLTDRKKEINSAPMGPWGWGMNPWMWGNPWMMGPGMGGGFRVEKYDLGEVVVDFIDTRQDKVVMRISAVGEINKPDQRSRNLKASVDKILKEFARNISSRG
ncbi:hypothetical protein ADIS_2858 [Lunatimonas lonarensis]|uniref:DUF4136 domain-containing protein n=2 Tax=Lunatimonas lonarensis TaxID=1232681 RepID=R7ZQS8_9BACT|nr:hypothetical protein ADIS_2858 [Lunatimonas lonarensis]